MALVNVTISYRLHVYSVKMILTLASLQIDSYKIGFQSSNRNLVCVNTNNRIFWEYCNDNFCYFYEYISSYIMI